MRATFRLQLVLLVLLNVMFVHITGAVGLNWLLPLYAATLLAPLLVRFHDALWYRLGWNLGVVAIFSILLTDATTTGITFLLEDGLILAAFCQVHLVNVIKRQSGADLLFFNSFLITLVTSLFCQDLVFSIVFAIYALVLVVALHASTIVTARLSPDRSTSRFVFRQGARRAISALVVTTAVFLFLPRDFRRQGIVSDDLLNPLHASEPGFSEEIRLGQSAARPVQQRIVMRIQVVEGDKHGIPELWRGATLSYYDSNGWQGVHMPQSTTLAASDGGWQDFDRSTVWRRGERHATSARYRVECAAPVPKRLFLPLGAHEVRLTRPSYVDPLIDGTLRYDSGAPLSYEVSFANDGFDATAGVRLASYRYLNRESVPADLGDRLVEAPRSLPEPPTRLEV
ncbi:MAG: DUF3488 domain-containing protein, partial [Planctomycetes bacterium]|nr:DUF3488 domain-containing protein [Planctomycetota bacterium]